MIGADLQKTPDFLVGAGRRDGPFLQIFESSPIATYATDEQGCLTYFNPAAVRLSGRVPQLGSDQWCVTWKLFLPDGTPMPHNQCPMAIALQGGAPPFGSEFIAERPDGSRFWFVPYPTVLRNASGEVTGAFNMLVDVTERKAALRESEEHFKAIFETTPECVKIVARDGTLLHMNPAGLCMIAAQTPEAVVGKSIYEVIAPDDRELFRDFNERICRGERGTLEFEMISLDGARHQMESHAAPLMRSDRSNVQLAVTRDITERKQAERAGLLLRAIVDSSEDAIISKDLNGVIMSWNQSAERLFGYTEQEAIGQSVATLLIPSDRQDEEVGILSRLRRGERVDHFETIRRHKNGTLLDISLTISPVKDARGRIVGASKIARDITERKRTERAALLLAAIVDSSDDAIISKDLDGVITSWNKSAERLFGYTAREAIGKHVAALLIPSDRQEEEPDILARLRRGERVDHFETIRKCKDGTLLEVSLTISPVKDAHGRIIGASKIARDITGRRRAKEAIQALNEQLHVDVAALTRMQQLSTRLLQTDDFSELLQEIIGAGIEITGADKGNIQLTEEGVLKLVAQKGFDRPFLDFFQIVHEGDAACGMALHKGVRVVVDDVSRSSMYSAAARQAALDAGVLAVQSTPLISRSGQVVGIFSTHYSSPHRMTQRELRMLDVLARQAADLIERSRAEAALLASEGNFRQLADSMPQIVWTARPDGYLDYYNERWYEFTGFPRNVSGDFSLEPILHPDDLQIYADAWYASVRAGKPYQFECRFWDRHENRWRWFMARALPVRGPSGQIVKWFGSFTDIDHQKAVQDELRRANADLEQFAYSASHDLQEPLRTIKIYSELLSRRYTNQLEGEALEFLGYLRTGAARMENLVEDLLAYTRITKLDEPLQESDCNEALEEALSNLAGAISETGARITADPLPQLRVHRTHLQQLFQNIVGNAIKYRSPERTPLVHVTGHAQDGHCMFAISDNGIGIDPQYKEGIFGLFKRLHTNDTYSGTGIGLAICQRIVDRYHGRIWVESEPGAGSTFRLVIPV